MALQHCRHSRAFQALCTPLHQTFPIPHHWLHHIANERRKNDDALSILCLPSSLPGSLPSIHQEESLQEESLAKCEQLVFPQECDMLLKRQINELQTVIFKENRFFRLILATQLLFKTWSLNMQI